jgi:Uma2 family endonuclease
MAFRFMMNQRWSVRRRRAHKVQLSTAATLILEEFFKLPETKPSLEYINGQVIQKPMPQGKHSKLQGKLFVLNTQIND